MCNVSAVSVVHAKLAKTSFNDVSQTENEIVSSWRCIPAKVREFVDWLLRRLPFGTRLFTIKRHNSIAVYFICPTLSAVVSLRDQWRSQQLRDIVEKLFNLLSTASHIVLVKRLIWSFTEYERCLYFFNSVQGNDCVLYISKRQGRLYIYHTTKTAEIKRR